MPCLQEISVLLLLTPPTRSRPYSQTPRWLQPSFQVVSGIFLSTVLIKLRINHKHRDLFYATTLGNYTYSTGTIFNPGTVSLGGSGPSIDYASLYKYDIYYQADFKPRYDIVNGSAPANSGWHVNNNTLPENATTPYYIANNFGNKYLNSEAGYQIIEPLSTAKQSGGHNFTLSYITISKVPNNITMPNHQFGGYAAIRMLNGALKLKVQGYDSVTLLAGDVASLPGGTKYKYEAVAGHTKFLYAGAGTAGIDTALLEKAEAWGWTSWPTHD